MFGGSEGSPRPFRRLQVRDLTGHDFGGSGIHSVGRSGVVHTIRRSYAESVGGCRSVVFSVPRGEDGGSSDGG